MSPMPCGRYVLHVFAMRVAMERLYQGATSEWPEHLHVAVVLGLS